MIINLRHRRTAELRGRRALSAAMDKESPADSNPTSQALRASSPSQGEPRRNGRGHLIRRRAPSLPQGRAEATGAIFRMSRAET